MTPKFTFFLAALSAIPLCATTIHATGDADYYEAIGYAAPTGPLGTLQVSNTAGTISATESAGTFNVTSSVTSTGKAVPNVIIDSSLTQNNGGNEAMESQGHIYYYVKIVPIAGSSNIINLGFGVLHVTGAESASVSNTATALTTFSFGSVNFPGITINGLSGLPSQSILVNQYIPLFFVSNSEYLVSINAATGVYGNFNSSDPASSHAEVDPIFDLAPELQGAYELEFSPNLEDATAVPEPRSFAFVVIGMVLCVPGMLLRRSIWLTQHRTRSLTRIPYGRTLLPTPRVCCPKERTN